MIPFMQPRPILSRKGRLAQAGPAPAILVGLGDLNRRSEPRSAPAAKGLGIVLSYATPGTLTINGLPAVVRGRQLVIEAAEVTPHPARDGW